MGEGGVGTLRAIMNWAAIDPTGADDYNWQAFDDTVAESAKNGMTVLPFIFATPAWVSELDNSKCKGTKCSITPVRNAAGLAAWNKFVGDAVARYGPDGEFWAANPGLPKLPIQDWQIWNEMNSKSFYLPKPSPKGYAKLLSSAADAIRSRDPAAEIILGGMPSLDGSKKAVPGPDYLADLYKVPGVEADFDGVAVHPYGAGLPKVKDQVLRVPKRDEAREGQGQRPLDHRDRRGLGQFRQPPERRQEGPGEARQGRLQVLPEVDQQAQRRERHLVQLARLQREDLRLVSELRPVHEGPGAEAIVDGISEGSGESRAIASPGARRTD